jgi:hypothetical protein
MRRSATVSIRLVLLFALLFGAIGVRTGAAMAQGDISTVVPAPELPGVPGDIPIAGFATLELEGGNYQWQTKSLVSGTRDDDPFEVHNGFLLSLDQPLVVVRAGAPSRPVPAGNSIPLTEGESIKPVTSSNQPGNFVLVEFVAEADLRDGEQADQTLPLTLEAGTYTIALLDITNLPEGGPTPGQLIAQGAGPGFSISSREEGGSDDIPLVIWLASVFRTEDATTEPVDDGSEAESSPVGIIDVVEAEDSTAESSPEDEEAGEPTPTEESVDEEATAEATATEEPVDEEPTAEPTEEAVEVVTAPVLPGVPADIPLLSFTVLELPAGDYQWQTRSMTSLTRTDDPLDVHAGFLIAVDQPVIVLKAGAPSQPVQAGEALILEEGDRILPTSSGDTPANLVIVELVAIENIAANETPDEVLPLTLETGIYTLAVLDISGIGEGGPTPGEIIAEAAGPGFGISADEETGTTTETVALTWLVSIFPASEEDLPGGGGGSGSGSGDGSGGGDGGGFGGGEGDGEDEGTPPAG